MIRRKKRKHCVREGTPLLARTAANQEWALDFAHDAVACGRSIRVLSVVGCVHARVSGVGGGHEFCQPESDASVGTDCDRARAALGDPLRQRAGTDEPAFPGVVRGAADRVGAHSARKADAECARRKFQRTAAGRMSEPELVSESVRCAAEDRCLEDRVQPRASAQQLGIPDSERVRRASRELLQS